MANKKKKCKFCKKYSDVNGAAQLPAGYFCNLDHAISWARDQSAKRKEKRAKVQHKADKERIKPKAKWLAELQALVNKYVRLRDHAHGCISCDKPASWGGQWHASHLHSRGHSANLRFNLWNIHKGCSVCNSHLSGNIGQYTPRLIEKIGQQKVDWMEANKSQPKSYEIEYIKRAIKIARKAIKREERKRIAHMYCTYD